MSVQMMLFRVFFVVCGHHHFFVSACISEERDHSTFWIRYVPRNDFNPRFIIYIHFWTNSPREILLFCRHFFFRASKASINMIFFAPRLDEDSMFFVKSAQDAVIGKVYFQECNV